MQQEGQNIAYKILLVKLLNFNHKEASRQIQTVEYCTKQLAWMFQQCTEDIKGGNYSRLKKTKATEWLKAMNDPWSNKTTIQIIIWTMGEI